MNRGILPPSKFPEFFEAYQGNTSKYKDHADTLYAWHGASTEIMRENNMLITLKKQDRLNYYLQHEAPLLLEHGDQRGVDFYDIRETAYNQYKEEISEEKEESRARAKKIRRQWRYNRKKEERAKRRAEREAEKAKLQEEKKTSKKSVKPAEKKAKVKTTAKKQKPAQKVTQKEKKAVKKEDQPATTSKERKTLKRKIQESLKEERTAKKSSRKPKADTLPKTQEEFIDKVGEILSTPTPKKTRSLKRCPYCKAMIEPGVAICDNCGESLV